jgi:hypothetical protein
MQDRFKQPKALSEVGESVTHRWPQVVGIASIQEIYKMIDSLQPPMAHIWLTLLKVFINTFVLK